MLLVLGHGHGPAHNRIGADALRGDLETILFVQETELEAREAEVAHLSEPKTKEQLNEAQLSRLQQQEAEIAELRRRLGEGQHGAAEPSTIEGSSSRERHRIIRRLPDIPKPACRCADFFRGSMQSKLSTKRCSLIRMLQSSHS